MLIAWLLIKLFYLDAHKKFDITVSYTGFRKGELMLTGAKRNVVLILDILTEGNLTILTVVPVIHTKFKLLNRINLFIVKFCNKY